MTALTNNHPAFQVEDETKAVCDDGKHLKTTVAETGCVPSRDAFQHLILMHKNHLSPVLGTANGRFLQTQAVLVPEGVTSFGQVIQS